jgi:hypothetical protein
MNWFERTPGSYVSSGYQLHRETMGYSAWIYSKAQSGCLGKGLTLKAAQELCEKHKSTNAKGVES